jgi:hypothetical protein
MVANANTKQRLSTNQGPPLRQAGVASREAQGTPFEVKKG